MVAFACEELVQVDAFLLVSSYVTLIINSCTIVYLQIYKERYELPIIRFIIWMWASCSLLWSTSAVSNSLCKRCITRSFVFIRRPKLFQRYSTSSCSSLHFIRRRMYRHCSLILAVFNRENASSCFSLFCISKLIQITKLYCTLYFYFVLDIP